MRLALFMLFTICFATVNAEEKTYTFVFSADNIFSDVECSKLVSTCVDNLETVYLHEKSSNAIYAFDVSSKVYESASNFIALPVDETITLPTFNNEQITKVVVKSNVEIINEGRGKKLDLLNASDDAVAATATKDAMGSTATFTVSSEYQSSTLLFKNTSTDSQQQIQTITITTETVGQVTKCSTPTITSPENGDVFYKDNISLKISCTTDGVTIYYTTDGSTPSNESKKYDPNTETTIDCSNIQEDETLTVKAIAYKDGMEASDVVTSITTKVRLLNGISGLRTKITEDNSSTSKTYYVKHGNIYVNRDYSSTYFFMQDDEAGVMCDFSPGANGTIYGEGIAKVKGYYDSKTTLVTMTSFQTTGKGDYSGKVKLQPIITTISEILDGKYEGMLVKVHNVKVTESTSTNVYSGKIEDDDNKTCPLSGGYRLAADYFSTDSRYSIVGIPTLQSDQVRPIRQLRFCSATQLEDVVLTISPSGYSSLYYSNRNLALPEGVKGYVCSHTEGSNIISATEVYSYDENNANAVPKDCAVILEGKPNSCITLKAVEDENVVNSKDPHENILLGTDEDETINAKSGKYLYFFGYDSNNNPGFFMDVANGTYVNNVAHMAYISIDYNADAANAKPLTLDFGTATSINDVSNAEKANDGKVYTMSGIEVNGNNLKSGLYIKNGHKFIVK